MKRVNCKATFFQPDLEKQPEDWDATLIHVKYDGLTFNIKIRPSQTIKKNGLKFHLSDDNLLTISDLRKGIAQPLYFKTKTKEEE